MGLFTRGKQKIHFVHIPKTGGTSVTALLESQGWEKSSAPPELWPTNKMEGHPQRHIWEEWEEVKDVDFRFSLVRNPYSRIKSLIKMWIQHDFWDSPAADADAIAQKLLTNDLTKEELEIIKQFYHRGSSHFIDNQTGKFISLFDVTDAEFLKAIMKESSHQQHSVGVVECSELSQKNIEDTEIHLKHNFIASVLKEFFNIDLFEGDVEKMIRFYFGSQLSRVFDHGLNPTPMHSFVSDKVKIYKMENEMENLLIDLKNAGFVDKDSEIVRVNESSLCFEWKPFMWSENSPTQKIFSLLYDKDFDFFGYPKELPLEEKL